jgi:hypothetical protein
MAQAEALVRLARQIEPTTRWRLMRGTAVLWTDETTEE